MVTRREAAARVEQERMEWVERLNRLTGRLPMLEAPGVRPFGVEILHWAYERFLPDNAPHRHTYFEVCLVGDHGAGEYRVEGTPHPIGPGDLFIARPAVLHQIVNTTEPRMELFWVSFHAELTAPGASGDLTRLFHRFAEAADLLVIPDTGGEVRAVWNALRAAADSPWAEHAGFSLQASGLMSALLIALARLGGDRATDPSPSLEGNGESAARRAVRYLHDNLSRRDLAMPELAAHAGISLRQLTRLFTRVTGVAPAAYLETARMQRARTLLLRTDDPVKQVGALVGYEDVHHFTRVFTRAVGCPPATYRRTRGSAAPPTPGGANIPIPGTLV